MIIAISFNFGDTSTTKRAQQLLCGGKNMDLLEWTAVASQPTWNSLPLASHSDVNHPNIHFRVASTCLQLGILKSLAYARISDFNVDIYKWYSSWSSYLGYVSFTSNKTVIYLDMPRFESSWTGWWFTTHAHDMINNHPNFRDQESRNPWEKMHW